MFSFGTILSFSYLTLIFSVISAGAHPLMATADKALGSPSKATNAMRLARGLPPLPPTKRYFPHAQLARRSAVPVGSKVQGGFTVKRSSDGTQMGYLGQYGKDVSQTPYTSFAYDQPANTGDFVRIYYTSNSATGWIPYGSTTNAVMGSGQSTELLITWLPVNTAVGAAPYNFGSGFNSVESTIFSIAANGKLTPTWVNPGGGRVVIVPCSKSGWVSFVGSTTLCSNAGGIPVDLWWQ